MNKRVLSNISFNFVINIITYVFSFLTLMYITRVLQPETYGETSFAASFSGFFVLLANLGMPIYAIRACAKSRDSRKNLSRLFNELWSISVVLSVMSFVLYGLTLIFVSKIQASRAALGIWGTAIIFQMFNCEWLFKGLEKFKVIAVSEFICKGVSLGLILLLIHSKEQVLLYSFLIILMTYGSSIICFLMIHNYVDLSFRIRINSAHFKPLLVFFMMTCAVTVYSNLDLTMLGFMRTNYDAGLYSIAAKGKSVLAMTGGLVWTAVLPYATNLWNNGDRESFKYLTEKSIIGVCTTQFFVMVLCMIFAKWIILLVGGEAYLAAVTAFRILLFSLIPIGASNILGGQVLIPAGKETRVFQAEIAGAIFNFFANLILIPHFSINGAAITTVISEIIVLVVCGYYVRKDLNMVYSLGLIVRGLKWVIRVVKRPFIKLNSCMRGDILPYYCPCCDTYLNEFIGLDYSRRTDLYNPDRYMKTDQKVICPVCSSLPRHRILVSYFEKHMEIVRNKSILHFAPEKSVSSWIHRNNIVAISADLKNSADLSIDVMDTGLRDASFDVIIINHVIEHVADFRKALKELYRVVKPGGSVFISFPVDMNLETVYEDENITSGYKRMKHFGQFDHHRVFGRDSVTILVDFGFEAEEIKGEEYDDRIKPVVGPADYDYNVVWKLEKKG